MYEGFGLPPLEAMACGCPVVVSNASSLPEVCGDAAYYFDPHSIEALVQGMSLMMTDRELRSQYIARGLERARSFTWQRCAAATRKVYEEAYQCD
ncbi:MAG: glycosyltransferase [Endomicrobiales bacterium]